MIQRLLRGVLALFPFSARRKLPEPSSPVAGGSRMSRRVVIGIVLVASLVGAGYGGFVYFTRGTPPPPSPVFDDTGRTLPTQPEFDALAEKEPVKMLAACLSRYQREVRGGLRCTVEKQERIGGLPKHPEPPTVEVIDLRVRGDVPDPETKQTAIEVLVKWKSGAKKPPVPLAAEIEGTLFSELPPPQGYGGKAVTWQPAARFGSPVRDPMDANSSIAKAQSRFCVRDAGIYRSMLRTHEAWKARQEAGEFRFEYLGTEKVAKAGGRECHKVRRICPRTELDAFELGGTASTDPKVVAAEGFTEVVIYIDRERWLQVATEVYRTEPDGTRVTVATYYFRDVELNPTFPPDTFTTAAFKK